jgi:hypothetical protein
MYYIYEIKNLINNKTYIGKHKYEIGKTPETDSYMGSGVVLHQAYEKYGKENFKKTILIHNINTIQKVNKLEKYFISMYRKYSQAEYNMADGGDGGYLGESACRKISESNKGKTAWNKGIKTNLHWYTDGINNICSDVCPIGFHKGRIMKGHKLSDETKLKIGKSNSVKLKGKKQPREMVEKRNAKIKELWKNEEYRIKQHNSRLGHKGWNKSIPMSEETKMKQRLSHLGKTYKTKAVSIARQE